jgi:uncharacterized membrane protein YagU involved in acid resistance
LNRAARLAPNALEWWATHGIIGGVVGGVALLAYEMAVAVLLRGGASLVTPLRMIGAIVLGQGALAPTYPLAKVSAVGLVMHMMLSVLFGVVFAVIAWALPVVRESAATLVMGATMYGLLVWLLDLHVVAPLAGWGWFPAKSPPLVQLLAHTFAFGAVLGLYLDRTAFPPRFVERVSAAPRLRKAG